MRAPDCTASIIIEVGPTQYWSATPAEARKWAREDKKALEALIRNYLRVGPYSKTVRARVEQNTGSEPK